MTAAIFAVVSPLQYINALEAVAAFGLKPHQCYLALGESKKLPATGSQVRSLLDPERWRAIQSITGVPVPRGKNAVHTEIRFLRGARQYANLANKLIRQARMECGAIKYVFLGDYRPANFRHFLGAIPEAEHWLLDDGSVTHQVVRFRKDRNSPHLFAKPFAQPNVQMNLRSRLSGLKFAEPKSVGYFTCYDIDPPLEDKVRPHDYSYYRDCYRSMNAVDEVWFLGANHIENQFTTKARYYNLLKRVLECYAGERVVYLPHRGENEATLRAVSAMGFELRNFDLPIEIAVGRTGSFPKVLAGIASSAIDNLSIILRERLNVHLFCVADGYSPPDRWRHLKDVIGYHERNVLGLTSFVYEDDYGARTGPVTDYRLSPPDVGQPESRCGGYFCGPDGFLHGFLQARLRLGHGAGVNVSFGSLPHSRDFRVGDRIALVREDNTSVLASIEDVLLSGEVIVNSLALGASSLEGPWTVELLKHRLEHYSNRQGIAGLLLEPARENQLLHSVEPQRSSFVYQGVYSFADGSMSASGVVSGPEGRGTAAFLKLDRSQGMHSISQVVRGASVGESMCFSVFLRYGGCERLRLVIEHAESGTKASAEYFLSGSGAPQVAEEEHRQSNARAGQKTYRDGWARCSLSAVLPKGDVRIELQLAIHDAFSCTGDGCSGVYLWGPQLERGTTPSSFLPSRAQQSVAAADWVDFEFETGEETLFLELSLPYTMAPIALLNLSGEYVLEIEGAIGRLRVWGAGSEHFGEFGAIGSDEPFVLGIRRQGDRFVFFVNGGGALCEVASSRTNATVRVIGGPLHMRRSYLHRSTWSSDVSGELCSVAGLSALK